MKLTRDRKEWLFLRPFEEGADRDLSELPRPSVYTMLLFTAGIPLTLFVSILSMVTSNDRTVIYCWLVAVVISAALTVLQVVSGRPGNAKNQTLITILFLVMTLALLAFNG